MGDHTSLARLFNRDYLFCSQLGALVICHFVIAYVTCCATDNIPVNITNECRLLTGGFGLKRPLLDNKDGPLDKHDRNQNSQSVCPPGHVFLLTESIKFTGTKGSGL